MTRLSPGFLKGSSAGGGGGGGATTFATIFWTDLVFWFDSSDAASVINTSGNVTQWNDKSGHGYHLSLSGAGQPFYSPTGLGGSQPSVAFSAAANAGGGTGMRNISGAAFGMSSFAAFAVVRMNSASAIYGLILGVTPSDGTDVSAGTTAAILLARNNNTAEIMGYRNSAQRGSKLISYDTTVRLASTWDNVNNNIFVNNVVGTTVADSSGALANLAAIEVGGQSVNATYRFTGHICEMAFVGINPSSAQRSAVDAMLAAKWTV